MDQDLSIDQWRLLLIHMGAILYVLYLLAMDAIKLPEERDDD